MATTIKLKNGSGAPLAGDLVQGEPALDLTNKRLYTEDAGGNVIEIGTSPSTIDINAGTIDGVTLGTNSAVTEAQIDNININGNTIISTDTNGNIAITPNGTGEVDISKVDINGGTIDGTVIGGASAAAGTFTSITGTGLTVNGDATLSDAIVDLYLMESDTTDANTLFRQSSSTFRIDTINDAKTVNTPRFKIDHTTGDISFYEDTGTTPKLFWDASAESLGIGTTSPTSPLTIAGSAQTGAASSVSRVTVPNTVGNRGGYGVHIEGGGFLGGITAQAIAGGSYPSSIGRVDVVVQNGASTTTAATFDASGNLGIGTTSPSELLTVAGRGLFTRSSSNTLTVQSTGGGAYLNLDGDNGDNTIGFYNGYARFYDFTNNTERMRLDSSGGLYVSCTTYLGASSSDTGSGLYQDGLVWATRSGNEPLVLNRLSSDGTIATFRKDGTTVGSIGSEDNVSSGDTLYILSGDTGLAFYAAGDVIYPCTTGGAGRDGAIDLGSANPRFKDLYLSGGVYVGGTTSANLLDDYEEGTWTPVPTSTGATFTTSKSGEYTKIGRLVYFKCFLDNSSAPTGTLTNEMTIAGLPFTSESGGYGASVSIGYLVSVDYPAGALELVARVSASSTSITLGWTQDDSTLADFFASAFDATDARIAITGCYQAA